MPAEQDDAPQPTRAALAADSRDSHLALRRIERQQWLIERLHRGRGERVSLRDLATELQVSRKTVARDVERLRLSGVPLTVHRGRGGGVSLTTRTVSGPVDLSLPEIAALLASLAALGPTVSDSAGSAMHALVSVLQPEPAAGDPREFESPEFDPPEFESPEFESPGPADQRYPRHRMPAADAVDLLDACAEAGLDICVGGGWAVDALVGRQTRAHADLDLWLPAEQLDVLIEVVAGRGLDRLLPWGGDRPWNVVLHDGDRHRVDLHLYEVLSGGEEWHYGSTLGGERLPSAALSGRGRIGGRPVRCDDAEWSLRWHTGYPPRAVDRHDVAQLCATFGFAVPDGF